MEPSAKTKRERERERLLGKQNESSPIKKSRPTCFLFLHSLKLANNTSGNIGYNLEYVVGVEEDGDDSGGGGGEEREGVAVHQEPRRRLPLDELVGHVDAAAGAVLDHEQAQGNLRNDMIQFLD